MRTKWMRLGVNDPADILRWAGAQNTRRLDTFRHRVIHGREFVSFRLVPRYRVEIGTNDIIVVAHVKPSARQRLATALARTWREGLCRVAAIIAACKPESAASAPARSAAVYRLAAVRR